MRFLSTILSMITVSAGLSVAAEPAVKDTKVYELRTYFAAPGKLPALQDRFKNHTVKLFEKHGFTNIGYWTPIENTENKLVYIVAFPSLEAKAKAWKDFIADPDWKKAQAESEKDGKLITKIDSLVLSATDFSPAIKATASEPAKTFELRTYTTTPGNLVNLHNRFRNHTMALFSKHGMTHFGYWQPLAKQPGSENTLIYLLTHESKEACAKSFAAFRADPIWIEAKAASEKAAGGSLTVENGVKSELLVPTEYSPAK